MSNYKAHALAGILFALPFIPSVFYLFFALLGASIPDMDHTNNKNKVYSMFVVGIILAFVLSMFGGVSISAMIIILLAIIFYLSNHRGFTHTLIGIVCLSFLFTLVVMGFVPLINKVLIVSQVALPNTILLFAVMVLVGYFIVSRRYLLLYVILLAIYLVMCPVDYSNMQGNTVFLMFFLGALSHIVLDLWTPAGICIFKPISNTKYHKNLAIVFFLIWLVSAVCNICSYGSLFDYFAFIF